MSKISNMPNLSRRDFNKLAAAGIVTAAGALITGPAAAFAEDAATVPAAGAEVPPMNSWRFKDGQPIEDAAGAAAQTRSAGAWSAVNNGYVNANGQLIPGAVKRGIDVSEWQKEIDWDKAGRDDIDFAILRCGWGTERLQNGVDKYKDGLWDRNVAACERLQIPYGTYLYSYATSPEWGRLEAEHVLKILNGRKLAYPVFFDMEDEEVDNAGNYYEIARAFCERIEAAGYRAGVYANLNWWQTRLTDSRFDRWVRWVARYQGSATGSGYAGTHSFWQCTSVATVAGVPGTVDLNFEYSTAARRVLGQSEIKAGAFYDCPTGEWYVRDGWVPYAVTKNLMSGGRYPTSQKLTGYFDPEGQITRGQVATVLYRIANPSSDATSNPSHYAASTGFSDGGTQPYYFAAVKWLKDTKISTGDKSEEGALLNTFRPDASITRQELATLVQRFAEQQGVKVELAGASDAASGAATGKDAADNDADTDKTDKTDKTDAEDKTAAAVEAALKQFKDGDKVLPYAREAMAWCNERGVITGGQGAAAGLLMPGQNATRAQAAKIFSVLRRDVLKLK